MQVHEAVPKEAEVATYQPQGLLAEAETHYATLGLRTLLLVCAQLNFRVSFQVRCLIVGHRGALAWGSCVPGHTLLGHLQQGRTGRPRHGAHGRAEWNAQPCRRTPCWAGVRNAVPSCPSYHWAMRRTCGA